MVMYHGWPNANDFMEMDPSIPRKYNIEDQIAPLIDWIQTRTNAADIEAILRFQSTRIRDLVGRHTRVLTDTIVRQVPITSLAQNPHLSSRYAAWVAEQAITLITHEGKKADPEIPTHDYVDVVSSAANALETIIKAGHRIAPQMIDRIVDGLKGSNTYTCISILIQLGAQVSPEQIDAAFENMHPTAWLHLINHPSTTHELQRKVLEKTRNDPIHLNLCERLCRNVRALSDPHIRNQIFQKVSLGALFEAFVDLAHADEEIFESLLYHLIEVSPSSVAWFVTRTNSDPNDPRINGKERARIQLRGRLRRYCLEAIIQGAIKSMDLDALLPWVDYEPGIRDVRIQKALLQHPHTPTKGLRALALYAQGENFRQTFKKWVSLHSDSPRHLIEILKEVAEKNRAGLSDLPAEDLLPLLQSPDENVRMATMRVLAYCQQERTVPEMGNTPDTNRENHRRRSPVSG